MILVEMREYLHDILVALDLIASQHVLGLRFVLAPLFQPFYDAH
jgi:hypothetical protein